MNYPVTDEAPAAFSTKRKLSTNTANTTNTSPNKAPRIVAINPPQPRPRRLSILRGGTEREVTIPLPCGHIACRLSDLGTCQGSETTYFSIGNYGAGGRKEDGNDDQRKSRRRRLPDASTTSFPQPQPKKTVSWHRSVADISRSQREMQDYRGHDFEIVKEWWEDDWQLKVCEFSLTKQGKLLDAFIGLDEEDVGAIVEYLPSRIRNMVMEISTSVSQWGNEEGDRGEKSSDGKQGDEDKDEAPSKEEDSLERAEPVSDAEGSCEDFIEVFTRDAEIENEVQENDHDDTAAAADKLVHQRSLLEFWDSHLEEYIFCRYQGTVRQPAPCPLPILRMKDISDVDDLYKTYGPTAYIVSHEDLPHRPLISGIRFSQAYMALKMYRLGENPKPWIRSLTSYAGTCGKSTNVITTSESWVAKDRLLLRTQSWLYAHNLYPQTRKIIRNFLNGEHVPAYDSGTIPSWICRHLSADPERRLWNFTQLEESAELRRCKECALEYRIDVVKSIPSNWSSINHHSVKQAFCAVVTVWRDFGRCLTPYDPRWTAHFQEYETEDFKRRFPAQNQAVRDAGEEESAAMDWELGGIVRAFEGTDEYLVDLELSLQDTLLSPLVSTEEGRNIEIEENRRKEGENMKKQLDSRLEEEESERLGEGRREEVFEG
ncbi:uncharacterized protein RAG0_06946 [Rhynchosporium agropyri]|uniref:Uncharacterized protein n=1 Tax=Rhynchosporium agropyri TaxID=914238 RepID=A0A1E1KJ81_9HELO|nr:uncharacterized protein RAG0_06946 [Rhynchosporium agropyri]